MFDSNQYQLLDFGGMEKVESFGSMTVCRPCPAAQGGRLPSSLRANVDMVYRLESTAGSKHPQKGQWHFHDVENKTWTIHHGLSVFQLRPTPFGHLGVFPEQAGNWAWLQSSELQLTGLKALNLFAYTGGTTMALAHAGCQVTHVDAAKNVVQWARENAAASGLGESPIRWIAEDVMRYLSREMKRGRTYDIVAADPPSFGRGPKNETWKLERDFPDFVRKLYELTDGEPRLLLISGHTTNYDEEAMTRELQTVFGKNRFQWERGPMTLTSRNGRKLDAGYFVRALSRTRVPKQPG